MYCNNCGKKVSGKKCPDCNTSVKIKNTLFGDYIFDYGKDKAKDTLFNKIVYFINNYLYGVVFTITVIGTVIVSVKINTNDKDVVIVQNKPEIVFNNISYTSLEDIENALLEAVEDGDSKTLQNMLLEKNYPNLAKEYGITLSDSKFIELVDKGIFSKNNANVYPEYPEQVMGERMGNLYSYSNANKSTCTMFECLDYSNVDYNITNYGVLISYYHPDTGAYLGQFVYFVDFVEIDEKFYIIGIVTGTYNPQIEEVGADYEKIDIDMVECIYENKGDYRKC